MMKPELGTFVSKHMKKTSRGPFVAGRLQTAMALAERLRDYPTLIIDNHKDPNSNGLLAHEMYGDRALNALALQKINKNHGRRSSGVGGWGQDLLDILKSAGFEKASEDVRLQMLDGIRADLGAYLKAILDEDPIDVRLKGKSAEAVIRDVIAQAEEKAKSGDVAQYLVAAKLMLRLGREIPVVPSNKGDRKSRSDRNARTGDFEIENATIEVAVGLPDEKHLSQVAEALEDTDKEVWLLTRHDRVTTWQHELQEYEGVVPHRVVVSSVEAFVGQNITEMGEFSSRGKIVKLQELFALYNERWVKAVGTPGIRIVCK